jgi:uncharacterized membrane protein YfcA
MRWRNLLILLLGHLIGSYAGAGLVAALSKAIDHRVPHSFWVLLKAAPLRAPQFVLFYFIGVDRPKLLAVIAVVVGYAAAFYGCWKLSRRFRLPKSCLERGRGFEVGQRNSEC